MKAANLAVFKGLNNTTDPLEMGNSYLTAVNNMNISDAGRLSSRDGRTTRETGSYTGAFSTRDFRGFVVDGGALKQVFESGPSRILGQGLSDPEMNWAEINRQVYFNNGIDAGVVNEDGSMLPMKFDAPSAPRLAEGSGSLPGGLYRVCCTYLLDDGRETGSGDIEEILVGDNSSIMMTDISLANGAETLVYISPANSTVFQFAFAASGPSGSWASAPEALGIELRNYALNCIPDGATKIAFFQGRLAAMVYDARSNQTAIYFSQPLGYHLWDYTDYIPVPGEGVQMFVVEDAMVIGTLKGRIYSYDGETLKTLAEFGAIPGQSEVADDNKTMLFLTERGPYSALPLTPLTPQVSFAPGLTAGGCLIQKDGGKKYLVVLQSGGDAFNARQ